MLYNCIKILHIVSATLLLTSIAYSIRLWRRASINNNHTETSENIQMQTWGLILPAAIFQLATGFTMISLQHYEFSQLWIKGSVIGFITVIASWFAFIYFLLSGSKKLQTAMLWVCTTSILCMIFFMANKVT